MSVCASAWKKCLDLPTERGVGPPALLGARTPAPARGAVPHNHPVNAQAGENPCPRPRHSRGDHTRSPEGGQLGGLAAVAAACAGEVAHAARGEEDRCWRSRPNATQASQVTEGLWRAQGPHTAASRGGSLLSAALPAAESARVARSRARLATTGYTRARPVMPQRAVRHSIDRRVRVRSAPQRPAGPGPKATKLRAGQR